MTATTPLQILQRTFGYPEFREPQADIIDTLLRGKDALVLMPTGSGKSLCYQIPALLREGTAIVISPLIALMQDQVDALRELGVRAGFLNSSQASDARAQTLQALQGNQLDLLYIAPERLTQSQTLELLSRCTIALFAIDEAHCVSQWGHDFRSDYLQLSLLQQHFPQVPRIALTATADPRTREEIAQRLGLTTAQHFVSSFDRPNIQYRICEKTNARQQLLKFIRAEHAKDTGIVYCLSRQKTEDIANWLCQQGLSALPYHAGMPAPERQHNQQRFLREDGIIMVATIAFGMGINKPDVRFVAHLDMPRSIEGYYQETGRAGRDGEPATAWMAYGIGDVIKLRQMLQNSEGSEHHKRNEQQKLNAMLGLCEITHCRRVALLSYFGESATKPCGNCDTCLNPPDTWDASVPVQKALSCIFRTGQRFGVNHLIDVLRGADNARVRQFGHQTLSTWGIGKDLNANQWRSLFRQLLAQGLISLDNEGHGALQLTEACRPVLRGENAIHLRQQNGSEAPRRQRQALNAIPPDQHPLWEALRALRKRLADEDGVPPYVIFGDRTLREMLEYRPRTQDEFLSLNGVGETKLARFGEAFLKVLHSDPNQQLRVG